MVTARLIAGLNFHNSAPAFRPRRVPILAPRAFFESLAMPPPSPQLPLAITMGDAAGIGPEIIARHIHSHGAAGLVIIGARNSLERAFRELGLSRPIMAQEASSALEIAAKIDAFGPVALIEAGELPGDLPPGRIDPRAGRLAYAAICLAIDLALAERIGALVTAPIHKEALHLAGVPFPGHTEILGHRTGTKTFGMMLANEALRVVLVSIHVPLREALERITFDNLLASMRLADEGCRALGIASPRIAVAGLNPHAGEGGLFGREEIEVIAPAVAAGRAEGLAVSGPFAPDTVFMRARQGHFDVVVALYHDQGLIPIKLGGLDEGVNITLGLPIIRTSVDHGTGFDIAGKGLASPASLGRAIATARRMIAVKRGEA